MKKTPKMLQPEQKLGESLDDVLLGERSKNKIVRPGLRPSREELHRMYITERQSTKRIGRQIGVSDNTVSCWLRQEGIKTRNPSEAKLARSGAVRPSKDDLYRMYVTEKKTTIEIGETIGVGSSAVLNWLRQEGIAIRTSSESQLAANGIVRPSKEELYRMYVTERQSRKQIGETIGVAGTTITEWLKEEGITTRNISEAALIKKGVVKPSREDLYRMYVTEKKSASSIAKIIGVGNNTVGVWLNEYDIRKRTQSEATFLQIGNPRTKPNHLEDTSDQQYLDQELLKISAPAFYLTE